MKLNFSKKDMEIGTFAFNYMRTLMVAATGGADVNECLMAAEKIKDDNAESWVQAWAGIAKRTAQTAEQAMQSGKAITARDAYLRASNYYRTAMSSLLHTDNRLDEYLTLSREYFHKAAGLFSPQIEVVNISFGNAQLPAYFLSAGQAEKRPTLIAINGGDSTNEELVHWIGFAAVERGWNCLVFEGPGQWSALQLNPGLLLRHDYEVPVKAVVDYLVQRNDVNADRIALIGYSLGTQLAVRAAMFDKRVSACICSGGVVVDVYQAWHGVWPAVIQNAPAGVFDMMFSLLEKVSPQVRGLTNVFRRMHGVSTPHKMIEAWRPFNIEGLAPKLECPLLLLTGEAEYAQLDEKVALGMMRFINELTCPVSIHEFTYEDGWAASHCQVGSLSPVQGVVFDWLDRTLNKKDILPTTASENDWSVVRKHLTRPSEEMEKLFKSVRINSF